MREFKKLIEIVDNIIKYVAIAAFSVMSVLIILQVIFRYLLGSSLSFSEELARFLFIWSSMLGAAMCLKRRSHIGFDLLMLHIPRGLQKYGLLITNVMSLAFYAILVIFGFKVSAVTMGQTSPAMGVKMGLIYASIAVAGFVMILNGIYNLIEDWITPPKSHIEKEVEESV